MTPLLLTDWDARVHTREHADSRRLRGFSPLVHTIDTHMTLILFKEHLSESIAKQAPR